MANLASRPGSPFSCPLSLPLPEKRIFVAGSSRALRPSLTGDYMPPMERGGEARDARSIPRTELVWPGKGAPVRPVSRATRLSTLEVIDPARIQAGGAREILAAPGGFRDTPNRLVLGDNLDVLHSLEADLAGRIDLIYVDPPFATGFDFRIAVEVGDSQPGTRRRGPTVEGIAYRDARGPDLGAYLEALHERLIVMRRLLSPRGTIWVHLDRRAAHPAKLVLDEVFGEDRLINEIAWCYTGPGSPGMRGFSNKHDTLFWYANGPRWTFNVDAVRLPYKESTKRNEGRRTGFTTGNPDLVVVLNPLGKHPEDWWAIPVEAPASSVRTPYPTQKPEKLLERILRASSREGDLVADFFSGSGTTLAVAEKLGRKWVGCDSSRFAIHTARKRLLEIPGARPFEIASAAADADGGRAVAPRLHAEVECRGDSIGATLSGYEPAGESDGALTRWSDAIDAWAVDWDFQEDGIFRPAFAAWRSRRRREIPLTASAFGSVRAARRIAIQAMDVFGSEALAVLEA